MLQLLQMTSSLFDCSSASTFRQISDSTLLRWKQTGFSEPNGILAARLDGRMGYGIDREAIAKVRYRILASVYCGTGRLNSPVIRQPPSPLVLVFAAHQVGWHDECEGLGR